jgi:outer membrane autotransporter protein
MVRGAPASNLVTGAIFTDPTAGAFPGDGSAYHEIPVTPVAGAPYLGGTINFTNSTAVLTGAVGTGPAGGILALYTDPTSPNVVNLDHSSVTTEQVAGVTSFGGLVNVNLTNGSQIIGGGGLLAQSIVDTFGDAGFLNLSAMSGSTMIGDAFADAVSTLNISLSGNSLWTGAAFNVTNVTLSNPSTWVMTANSTVSQTTTNAGLIQYTAPIGDPTLLASYKTLTTGSYVGQGGTIALHTYLGTDGSPSDRLIINGGTATGLSFLSITNTTGAGARTTGNGILVVDTINGGTTAPGAFSLAGRVAAGAFDYGLFRSSVDASNPDAWYLRSTGFRPEVAVDTVAPALAARLGLAMLGTYGQRTGDGVPQFCADDPEPRKPMYTKGLPVKAQRRDECHTLLWGRLFGAFGSFGSTGANGDFGKGGPAYDFDYGGLQAGADFYRTARDSAGLYAGAATARANVRTADGGVAGKLNMDAYGFGAYWTHRDPVGWYTDLVLQGNLYQNINTSSAAGVDFRTQGWGITASGEAGYKIALGYGYSVIPQGQLIYQRTSLDSGADQFGRISFGTTDEIYGRLGGRLAKDWLSNDNRKVTTWAEANIWQQFGSDAKTTFATLDGAFPTTVGAALGGTWAQLGLGLSGQVTRTVSIFGVADYNIALSQPGHSLGGRAGIRIAW